MNKSAYLRDVTPVAENGGGGGVGREREMSPDRTSPGSQGAIKRQCTPLAPKTLSIAQQHLNPVRGHQPRPGSLPPPMLGRGQS